MGWITWQQIWLWSQVSGASDASDPAFWVPTSSFRNRCLPVLTVDGSKSLWPTTVSLLWVVQQVSQPCVPKVHWQRCPSSRGGGPAQPDYSRERGKGVYVWRLFSLSVYSTFFAITPFISVPLLFALLLLCLYCCLGSFILYLIFFYCFAPLAFYFIAWFCL